MESTSCPTWISDILLQRFSTQCVQRRALKLGISPFTCKSERSLADVLPEIRYFCPISSAYEDRTPAPSSSVHWVSACPWSMRKLEPGEVMGSLHIQPPFNHFRDNWGGRWQEEEKFENCLTILLSNQKTHQKLRKSWGNYYSTRTLYNWSGTVCSWRWLPFLQTPQVSETRACGQDLKHQFKSTEDT